MPNEKKEMNERQDISEDVISNGEVNGRGMDGWMDGNRWQRPVACDWLGHVSSDLQLEGVLLIVGIFVVY